MNNKFSEEDIKKYLFALQQCYEFLRENTRTKWNRDLPFEELLFDRWTRAQKLGFKKNANIYHNSYVYGDVQVGENTWIGPFTLLDGSGGLTIGRYCSISAGVKIYTHDTVAWALTGGKKEYEKAPVFIGNYCHIGSDTIIIKGVTIGDHTVIGANSFVNSDIPSYSIAFGSPCRKKGDVVIDKKGNVSFMIRK